MRTVVHVVAGASASPAPGRTSWSTHLAEADPDALLVSACDKLHNARSICTDLRRHGSAVFDRFTGGQDGTLWYYRTLSDTFARLLPGPLAVELDHAVGEMERLTPPRAGVAA